MATISGYFFYASVQKPVTKYKKDNSKDPLDFEYKVDLLVNAKDYKSFVKTHASQKKKNLPDRAEFVERYGMEPPKDIQPNGDDEYCFITFKTNYAREDRKTGDVEINDKPAVLIRQPNGKNKRDDKVLVGNGSKGVVQYMTLENKEWNTVSGKLTAIRVDDLIEYSGGANLDELGELEEDSIDELDNDPNELGEEDDDTPPFATADDDDEEQY